MTSSFGLNVYIPDDGTNLDGSLTTKSIGDKTRYKGTQPRTTWHTSSDTTLNTRTWTLASTIWIEALVEVARVGLSGDNSRHGSNIKTEETTTNDGDGRNDCD